MSNRRQAMRAAIIEMVGELITEDLLRDIEVAAMECDDGESDKPVKAALSVTLKWQAGQDPCDMLAKCAYSVRHVVEADRVVDPAQMTLDQLTEGDK
jgi:hypothetical protein